MGMAKMAGAPVLLCADIDRGGVFASLYGTVALLEPDERALVRATVVNKFRGDLKILLPGLKQLEELTGRPVAGVVPWTPLDIDDEDSLSDRLGRRREALIDVAVIRLPRLSNFSDFSALDASDGVGVRYVENVRALGVPDLVVIPGTKNTIGDMKWLRASGLEAAVKKLAAAGAPVIGICGGYQMLGREIVDEEGVEGGGSVAGMGLLPVVTRFRPEKRRTRTTACAGSVKGVFAALSGAELEGYEIHCGTTCRDDGAEPLIRLEDGSPARFFRRRTLPSRRARRAGAAQGSDARRPSVRLEGVQGTAVRRAGADLARASRHATDPPRRRPRGVARRQNGRL